MNRRFAVGSLVAMLVGLAVSAPVMSAEVTVPEHVRELMVQLMQETKVAAVAPNGPAADFIADGDPNTLELVFLADKKDGPSHVSDDGEVIFIAPRTKDKVQQELISQAFYLRALRRVSTNNAETPPAQAPGEKAPN